MVTGELYRRVTIVQAKPALLEYQLIRAADSGGRAQPADVYSGRLISTRFDLS